MMVTARGVAVVAARPQNPAVWPRTGCAYGEISPNPFWHLGMGGGID